MSARTATCRFKQRSPSGCCSKTEAPTDRDRSWMLDTLKATSTGWWQHIHLFLLMYNNKPGQMDKKTVKNAEAGISRVFTYNTCIDCH